MDETGIFCLDNTVASLRIFGADLEPDEITKLFGKSPDRSKRKGDLIPRSDGTSHIVRAGSWSIQARETSLDSLDTQIRSLLKDIPSDPELWIDLNRKYRVDMFCGLFLARRNQGLEISPETLALLSDRGIKLGLDIYEASDFFQTPDPGD